MFSWVRCCCAIMIRHWIGIISHCFFSSKMHRNHSWKTQKTHLNNGQRPANVLRTKKTKKNAQFSPIFALFWEPKSIKKRLRSDVGRIKWKKRSKNDTRAPQERQKHLQEAILSAKSDFLGSSIASKPDLAGERKAQTKERSLEAFAKTAMSR